MSSSFDRKSGIPLPFWEPITWCLLVKVHTTQKYLSTKKPDENTCVRCFHSVFRIYNTHISKKQKMSLPVPPRVRVVWELNRCTLPLEQEPIPIAKQRIVCVAIGATGWDAVRPNWKTFCPRNLETNKQSCGFPNATDEGLVMVGLIEQIHSNRPKTFMRTLTYC